LKPLLRVGAPSPATLEQESRMKNPHPHSIMFERVSLADAKRVHDRAPANEAKPAWLKRRSANNNAEPLHPDTANWIRGLPADIRPDELARRYARLNRFSSMDRPSMRAS
jgi:hypothetical protein